jgi:hypothetical protein
MVYGGTGDSLYAVPIGALFERLGVKLATD